MVAGIKGFACTDSSGLCIEQEGELTEADAGNLHAIHTLAKGLFKETHPVSVCIDLATSQSIFIKKNGDYVTAIKTNT
eukprot:gene1353-4529_t